jgi:hypothetical protein
MQKRQTFRSSDHKAPDVPIGRNEVEMLAAKERCHCSVESFNTNAAITFDVRQTAIGLHSWRRLSPGPSVFRACRAVAREGPGSEVGPTPLSESAFQKDACLKILAPGLYVGEGRAPSPYVARRAQLPGYGRPRSREQPPANRREGPCPCACPAHRCAGTGAGSRFGWAPNVLANLKMLRRSSESCSSWHRRAVKRPDRVARVEAR